MALGIFGAAALPRVPGGAALVVPFSAALAVIWGVLAARLIGSLRAVGIGRHVHPVVDSFAIGTWIAGTLVVARLAMLAAPDLPAASVALFALAVALWLGYMPLALRNLARLAATPALRPSGIVLLATVATQAVALLALRLFPASPAVHAAAAALLALGIGCYGVGVACVLARLGRPRGWDLDRDWDNANCIIHGALSITGLAAVVGGYLSGAVVLGLWAGVAAVFVVVEAVEGARLATRVRRLGWRRAVLVYDPSQWARNFTVGMVYAFTVAFAERYPIGSEHPALDMLRRGVVSYGAYVVLVLLLVELVLMARAVRQRGDG